MCAYNCLCILVHVCECVHKCESVCICVHVCTCVNLCVLVHVCAYEYEGLSQPPISFPRCHPRFVLFGLVFEADSLISLDLAESARLVAREAGDLSISISQAR